MSVLCRICQASNSIYGCWNEDAFLYFCTVADVFHAIIECANLDLQVLGLSKLLTSLRF